MTCTPIFNKQGKGVGFICGSYKSLDELDQVPKPLKRCYICGKPATVLCDAPAGYEKTCNRPMCRDHAHNVGKDTDVCQEHYNDYEIEQAITNRLILAKGYWPIQDNPFCPDCESEEHSANAVYCKMCGTKLAKEAANAE